MSTVTETAAPPARPSDRRRRRARRTLPVAIVAVAAFVASACVPSDFVKHTSAPYWTWFAPPSWGASYGANGIDISNNIGTQRVSKAFAPIACSSGSTLQEANVNFYNRMRALVRDGSGLTQWQTLSASTPRLMPAAYGPNYFRQDITFQGRRANGTLVRGEGELDMQYTGVWPGCGYINQLRDAPASEFNSVIARLRSTQNSISYFAQGA